KLVKTDIAPRGAIRELVPEAEDADWDPSDAAGGRLAVVFSSGTGGESRLEHPIGRVLYRARSIRHPRFSPDGRHIAFLEDTSSVALGGRVGMVDLEGRFTALTGDYRSARGVAWSPRGDEVWFSAGAWLGDRALRAVDLRGRERLVLAAPSSLTLWDIAADGVLFTRDEDTRGLVGVPPGETAERDLSLYDNAGVAGLSADGRLLLFTDRFGTYVRSTGDSSPPMPLGFTEGFADDLSRDGTKVLATVASPSRLVIVPLGPGDRRELPAHGIVAYSGALWFPDGRRILFNGARAGEDIRAYVQDVEGGPPRAFTPPKTRILALSPDGEWAAGNGPHAEEDGVDRAKPSGGIWLWPVAGGPPRVVPRSQREDRPVAWTADGDGLWVFRRDEVPARVFRLDIATGRRELTRRLMPPDAAGVESIPMFRTTPSGETYFYTYRRVLSKLYLARDLR
ncbi:MAG TPA: hypothetical protein VMR21_04280, partial [Vicinamibacteria bacterium]|nr:hypothetical protein [Vicinamibacteria bacterium]